jgi:class 3 adenylate cyclase/tetratricopeptide (TPR) repeat protein
VRCAKCGFDNAAGARFCGDCGTALAAGSGAMPSTAAAPDITAPVSGINVSTEPAVGEIPDGERKTVTALFADIKGSMELMEDLDPEDARAIVDPALKLMIDAVHRYDGYIVQSTGDGIFALFGAPVAHEDHPQRALYAALRMQEDLKRYSDRLRVEGRVPLQARVGVNTGEVVVRSIQTEDGHAEYTPIGHSTGLAARMQTLAPIGSIAATQQTQKLGEGYFTFKSLGPTTVKGVSGPVAVFEVTGLGPLRTRLQVSAQRGLTKFVGRQAELEQMKHALELARAGHGQVVAAMGEPGVGKSRLVFEFKAIAQSDCLVLEAYSVSHGKASAYLPVIELLRDYFRIIAEDDPRRRRQKVIGKVLELDRSLEDTLPYVFAPLGIPEADDPLAQMDPQIRRRRTHDALKRIWLRDSLNQPLIMVFEDLHWIDQETQSLVDLLADSIANARTLLLVNYRPEYRHQWGSRSHYTQLRLDPLGSEGAAEMLDALLTAGTPLPDQGEGRGVGIAELGHFILERTQGNPFFIEEIVQALFDEGVLVRNGAVKVVRALAQVHLPPTVQGILTARIDRLDAPEKELLQTLAVLGREFPVGLVRSVTQITEHELEPLLDHLRLAEFVFEVPAFPEAEYTFKHALTQEVAYDSVLADRRKLLHERSGVAIESLYAGRLEDHLEELAHHYSRSDNVPKAVEYLQMAAAQAVSRSHYNEASSHTTAALKLLDRLPERSTRLAAELGLQMLTAQASMVLLGYNAPEVERALLRAESVCQEVGNATQMFPILSALRIYYLGFAKHRRGHELAQQLLEIAQHEGSKSHLAEAYFNMGDNLQWEGEFGKSLSYLERAIDLCEPGQKVAADLDALTMCLQRACVSSWCVGYADKALAISIRALKHTASLKHPMSMAVAHLTSAVVRNLRRDPEALEAAQTLLAFTTEHGLSFYHWVASALSSIALLERGSVTEALAGLLQVADQQRQLGLRGLLPRHLTLIAKAYGKLGNPNQGLEVISQAVAVIEDTSERLYEPEVHRTRGELLLLQDSSSVEQAFDSFRNAIEIARRQEARFYELRATMSLARLLAQQARRDEAWAMLAEIYNWFTEGFDTVDLEEAKALLDQLSG